MTTRPAHVVALPVLRHLDGRTVPGAVLGRGSTSAYADFGGFVVALTTREVPLMPNGVALAAGRGALPALDRGTPARLGPGRIQAGGLLVTWDARRPPVWDPAVAPAATRSGQACRRGEAILATLGACGGAVAAACGPALDERAVGAVLGAARGRTAAAAAEAAAALLGRGPGLTPEGDDLLAGFTAAAVTLGPGDWARRCVAGVLGQRPRERTTALSATLLELAARGEVVEPARPLLDLGTDEAAWRRALRRLLRVGHSTGRAYALGIGLSAAADGRGGRPVR